MNFLQKYFCKHKWHFHGWSYVKCDKCGKVEDNPVLNEKLQREFWERRVDESHPMFTRNEINKLLATRRRKI